MKTIVRFRDERGRFVKGSVSSSKRVVLPVNSEALSIASKRNAKIRANRPEVKRKKARQIKAKLKREYERLQSRDKRFKKKGRAEYLRREIDRGKFETSKDGSFRWRDFQLPDAERDTIRYAIASVSRYFTVPVTVCCGVHGFDLDGRPVGRPPDYVPWTDVFLIDVDEAPPDDTGEVDANAYWVDEIKKEVDALIAKYGIATVGALYIHVSEGRASTSEMSRKSKAKSKSKAKGKGNAKTSKKTRSKSSIRGSGHRKRNVKGKRGKTT